MKRSIKLFLTYALAAFACVAFIRGQDLCPCVDPPKEFDRFTGNANGTTDIIHTICILIPASDRSDATLLRAHRIIEEIISQKKGLLFSYEKVNSILGSISKPTGLRVAYNGTGNDCTATVSIVSDMPLTDASKIEMRRRHYHSCPGTCLPIPYVEIPSSIVKKWFQIPTYSSWSHSQQKQISDLMVSCSQTIGIMVDVVHTLDISDDKKLLSEFLRMVFWRRIVECKERKHWKAYVSTESTGSPTYTKEPITDLRYHVKPRKIFGLVIWIGSMDRFELMEQQALVLQDEMFDSYFKFLPSQEYIVPFFSSEVTFSCRPESTNCNKRNGAYLPKSDMNRMPEGWRCAQRRPLRTLAHTTLLFDPQFILMVDDDTYVNFNLLMERYKPDILDSMQRVPIVVGEYQGKVCLRTSL